MKEKGLLLNIFLTMMKIGLFTFGGGYAMLALLENEFVEKRGWMEKEEFLDMVAIAESTPGPIAINSATYIGYKKRGLLGSAFATVGVCIPSVVIIFLISLFLDTFLQVALVANAFRGIRVCVVYLILSAGLKMLSGMKKRPINIAIFLITLSLMCICTLFSLRFSSIALIVVFGLVGFILCRAENARKGAKK